MWNTDQPPLEYLSRRVIYYKKKKSGLKKMLKSGFLLEKYGKRELSKIIEDRRKQIENRIEEFNKAILKLKNT